MYSKNYFKFWQRQGQHNAIQKCSFLLASRYFASFLQNYSMIFLSYSEF